MGKKTCLYPLHRAANAQFVDFSGWEMPIHYGSQLDEHHWVRKDVGLFDVSHMGVVDISGQSVVDFLRYLLANDVNKLKQPGQALYTCMLNSAGGVIDDLIVYRINEQVYRVVLNAACVDKDLSWLAAQAANYSELNIKPRKDLAILALQGPHAFNIVSQYYPPALVEQIKALKPFKFLMYGEQQIARTGYTGEDGVEIILPTTVAEQIWQAFLALGAHPCGLGARDTLRLEAGLNLNGTDMNEHTTPLVANLGWTVALKDQARHFIGAEALALQLAAGLEQTLVGLIMQAGGVLRNHQAVFANGEQVGEITSGGFSPSLGHAIALARVRLPLAAELYVERRGKSIAVSAVAVPFVRYGKKVFKPLNKHEVKCNE